MCVSNLPPKNQKNQKIRYPKMELYEEILFLKHFFNGKYVVENVIPYYEPLIPAKKRGRHLYWTNFNLPSNLNDRRFSIARPKDELKGLCNFHDYDFNKYKGKQSQLKIARNLVDYQAGKTILEVALNCYKSNNEKQIELL